MSCCSDFISRLAHEHAGRLAALARREGLSAADALDAVQEAFQKLIGRHDLRDDPEQALRTLSAIVRNTSRNQRRLHRNARQHLELDAAALAADGENPSEQVDRARATTQLAGCMAQLGEVQRRIVTLRVLEELSGAEAAELLGLTPNHIAVLLHRAKRELERCMLTGS